ncbi:MAG TPA: peptidoglycan DD-metalloendopeptidase family protein, partial [Spirochaetota bacterium]|nr:peptidoglycan DD-metalloendopeptidase family protein [Spirochaetota bacterium]
AAHAGVGHREGVRAIVQLAEIIMRISKLTDYENGLTVNIGRVTGGIAINRVSHYAEAEGEMRAYDTEVLERGLAGLRALNGLSTIESADGSYRCRAVVRVLRRNPAWSENAASKRLFKCFERAADSMGMRAEAEARGGLSDGNFTWSAVPTIDGLGPDGENSHCSERKAEEGKDQEYALIPSFVPKAMLCAIACSMLAGTGNESPVMVSNMKKSVSHFPLIVSSLMALTLILLPEGARGEVNPDRGREDERVPFEYPVKNFSRLAWDRGDFKLVLRARSFSQGNAVWVRIQRSAGAAGIKDPELEYEGRRVAIARNGDDYEGLFAIAPDERPGKKAIVLRRQETGRQINHHFEFNVARTAFKQYPRPLDLGRYSNISIVPPPEVVAFIEACAAKKREVFERRSSGMLTGPVNHPRDAHFITSPFWAGRKYLRYRMEKGRRVYLKPSVNAHSGVDLRGGKGDPVFAMASGRVVIAEGMYYEGNFIAIDHGSGIFSLYMHLDGLAVEEGRTVRAGELIGHVGSTGLSTAAHLHVSVTID